MIDSVQKLYEYVNRFHGLTARWGETEGELVFAGVGRVRFKPADTQGFVVRESDLGDLVVRAPSTEWVPLSEFDEQGAAGLIERWEARHAFAMTNKNVREAIEKAIEGFDDLHPLDQSALSGSYKPELEEALATLPSEEDMEWPNE